MTPGASYVYERVGTRIYAREVGSSERKLIGYNVSGSGELYNRYFTEWNDILIKAETTPVLKEMLEEVLVVYNLIKQYE
jgi:hypothetical protein